MEWERIKTKERAKLQKKEHNLHWWCFAVLSAVLHSLGRFSKEIVRSKCRHKSWPLAFIMQFRKIQI